MLASDAVELLTRHSWPGNVRELENVIRSVSLFAEDDVIAARDFADYTEIFRAQAAPAAPPLALVKPASNESNDDAAARGPDAWARLSTEGLSLKELKTKIEVECISEALSRARGNITRAADLLGMKRPRLSQLIKEHGIALERE
jgi:DNA-binding NtrC family response regulator